MKQYSRKLTVLETNVDDMSPEWHGYLLERLLEEGALDAVLMPALMKKSRPAVILQVLCEKKKAARLLQVLFEESTTLGIRRYEVVRLELRREIKKVKTSYGPVLVKLGRDATGRVINAAPEYESCKALAKKGKVPLKRVYEAARRALKT